jgi:hypothetical protein
MAWDADRVQVRSSSPAVGPTKVCHSPLAAPKTPTQGPHARVQARAEKSELLRAGLQALVSPSDAQLQALLGNLTSIKPGRPKKSG